MKLFLLIISFPTAIFKFSVATNAPAIFNSMRSIQCVPSGIWIIENMKNAIVMFVFGIGDGIRHM
jgi:hypothetical protein